jgi:predicted nuclease of restriction endonuclease-like RecB superfamily
MLTSNLVRVRFVRQRIVPVYLEVHDPAWLEVAERLLEMFRAQEGRTRGELEEDIKETFGGDPSQLVHQGLAKLLEDRCEFEVVSGHPPEQLREQVFTAATQWRRENRGDETSLDPTVLNRGFDRNAILREVADRLGMTPEAVDQGLFADLKSDQRLVHFKDITTERLVQRYNVALAQSVLLRSTGVQVQIRGEPPQRFRQLFRQVKFHRLVCEVERTGPDSYALHLDGPLSLFSATQKYGLQLALFLPALLRCRDFELKAELKWGAQRQDVHAVL